MEEIISCYFILFLQKGDSTGHMAQLQSHTIAKVN